MRRKSKIRLVVLLLAALTYALPALLVRGSIETRLLMALFQAAPFLLLAAAWSYLRQHNPQVDWLGLLAWLVGFAPVLALDTYLALKGFKQGPVFGDKFSGLLCLGFWGTILAMVVFASGLLYVSLYASDWQDSDVDEGDEPPPEE